MGDEGGGKSGPGVLLEERRIGRGLRYKRRMRIVNGVLEKNWVLAGIYGPI